jgi:hypothetical protein
LMAGTDAHWKVLSAADCSTEIALLKRINTSL